jgi:T-complex protein 1 subunit alpha
LSAEVQVQVNNPQALEQIRQEEMEISMRRVRKILDAGANVVLTTKGIDDFCLKAFVDAGCIACRRVPKDDMKRIARATGATLLLSLAAEDAGEAFDAECLGTAEEVVEERVSDDDVVFIKGTATARCLPFCLGVLSNCKPHKFQCRCSCFAHVSNSL